MKRKIAIFFCLVLALLLPTLILTSCGGSTVSVRYMLNGGELEGAPESYNTASAPDFSKIVPTKENYEFGGWYVDKKLTTPFSPKNPGSDSVVLYAKWLGEEFSISYELDGGSLSNPISSYRYGERTVLHEIMPTKDNHVFVGWFTDAACTKRITTIDTETSGDMTLYAKFNPNPVKLANIPDVRRGFVKLGYSTSTVNLANYINDNGTSLTYTATSTSSDVVVSISGKTLTVKFNKSVCDATVTVSATYAGVEYASFEFSATAVEYKNIVCVGDSLTASLPAYPPYLADMLSDYGITVHNFGRSGTSISDYTNNPNYGSYTTYGEEQYLASLALESADLVIIMLGTNDNTKIVDGSTQYDWSIVAPNYKANYLSLINDYRQAYAGADIVIMSSPDVMSTNKLNASNDVLETYVYSLQQEIAKEAGAIFIDLRVHLRSVSNVTDLYRPDDGVHFSEYGANEVAKFVLKSL